MFAQEPQHYVLHRSLLSSDSQLLGNSRGHSLPVTALCSVGAGKLVSASDDRRVHLWSRWVDESEAGSSQDFKLEIELPCERHCVKHLCLLPADGPEGKDRVVIAVQYGSAKDKLREWDLESREVKDLLTVQGRVSSLCSVAGKHLVYGKYGQGPYSTVKGGLEAVTLCGEHMGGTRLMTDLTNRNAVLCLCEVTEPKEKSPCPGFASGSADGLVRTWRQAAPKAVMGDSGHGADELQWVPDLVLEGHEGAVRCISSHADSLASYLASGGAMHEVRVWRLPTGECMAALCGHTSPVLSIAFAPTGILASGSQDGEVLLWKANPIIGDVQEIQDVFLLGSPKSRRRAKQKWRRRLADKTLAAEVTTVPEPQHHEIEDRLDPKLMFPCLTGLCRPCDPIAFEEEKMNKVQDCREELWRERLKTDPRALDSEEEEEETTIVAPLGIVPTKRVKTYAEYRREQLKRQRENEMVRISADECVLLNDLKGNIPLVMAFLIWHATASPHKELAEKEAAEAEPREECHLCKQGRRRRVAYEELHHALVTMKDMQTMIKTALRKAVRADKAYVALEASALDQSIVKLIAAKGPVVVDPVVLGREPPASEPSLLDQMCSCCSQQPERSPLGNLDPQSINEAAENKPEDWGEAKCARCGRAGPAFDIKKSAREKPVSEAMQRQMSFIDEAARRGVREAARIAENAEARFEATLQRTWHRFEERVCRKLNRVSRGIEIRHQLAAALSEFQAERKRRRDIKAVRRLTEISHRLWKRAVLRARSAIKRVQKSLAQVVFSGKFTDSAQ